MRLSPLSRLLAIFQLLVGPGLALAQPSYSLLPEARAMRPPVMQSIPGSERAVLAAVKLENGEVAYLSKEELAQLEAAPPNFETQARETAAKLLETLEPRLIRSKSKVLECAVYESDSPLTAAVILAPNFLQKFENLFGPEMLVAIPSRYEVYIFPKIANRIPNYTPDILSDYRAAAYPVSPEIFEIGPKGIRAVGELDDR
ncbi:MAG TPA: hypothetical protein VIS74_00635 [Chthoniobacterales bacterium]